MSCKYNFCSCIIGLFLIMVSLPRATAATGEQPITIEQLTDTIEQMESAIVDISLEYEWLTDSAMTLGEKFEFIADKNWSIIVGPRTCKMVCSLALPDPNDPDVPLFDRFLFEKSDISMRDPNKPVHNLIKRCFNGQIRKDLYIGGSPHTVRDGRISKPDGVPHSWIPNPVEYFFILRCRAIEKMPLSKALRKLIVPVRINHALKKVGDFNTISAEFIDESTNNPFKQVCFSVDHDFTPVKYEDLDVYTGEPTFTVEITSLQEVAPGLWFPKSGLIKDHRDPHKWANLYQATGPIIVNQGLTSEDFDIDFPVGTKVSDKIQGREYVVKQK